MKRTERHHLKENEVAEWVMQTKDAFEQNRSAILYGGLAVLVVVVGLLGYLAWRQNVESNARAQLAAAMSVAEAPVTPPTAGEAGKPAVQAAGTFPTERAKLEAALPKLQAAADAFPDTDAGTIARFRTASALVGLGRIDEGIKQYQMVVDRGKGVYPVMARLGIADAQVLAGKYDQAITTYKDVSTKNAEEAPLDGVLMELARAYRLAGKSADARQTFKRVMDEFPQSGYVATARRELDTLDAEQVAAVR
jgi:predicted negative regulator of RcsB-dependent stress response